MPSRSALERRAFLIGGVLGPLGGGVTAPMLSDLAGSFGVSVNTAGWAQTFYFVPFAALQLVSGTLGERWGRRRTTQVAYVAYSLASVLCAVAPDVSTFLAGRVVQGAANAFTTPLLLAGLADVVPVARLSRTVGVFSACQAAGQSMAPLVGGVANTVTWRLAFVVVAAVSFALAFVPPHGGARAGVAAPRFAQLMTGRMGAISLVSLAGYTSSSALPFLVALYAERRFGTSSATVGLVIIGFGVAGMVFAAPWGQLTHRIGGARAAAVGLVGASVMVALVGHTTSTAALAVMWTLTGVLAALGTVGVRDFAAREVPTNRAGAVSLVAAFGFAGGAAAPLVFLPLYPDVHRQAVPQGGTAFLVAGIIGVVGAVVAAGLSVASSRRRADALSDAVPPCDRPVRRLPRRDQ